MYSAAIDFSADSKPETTLTPNQFPTANTIETISAQNAASGTARPDKESDVKRSSDEWMAPPVFESDKEALDYIEAAVESLLKISDQRQLGVKLGVSFSRVLDEIAALQAS